jgi:hypothetical protein
LGGDLATGNHVVSLQKRGIVKIDKYYNRGKYTPTVKEAEQKQSFFEGFDEFLKIKKFQNEENGHTWLLSVH